MNVRTSEWRVASGPGSKQGRMDRLENCVTAIRSDLVMEACRIVMKRYGVPRRTLREPAWILSDEEHTVRHTHLLQCGGATSEDFILYEPGIRMREAQGAHYALTVLHVYVHEYVHMISGELEKKPKKTVRVHGASFVGHITVSGYHVRLILEMPEEFEMREGYISAHTAFNEGVTESFAREVVAEYLRIAPSYVSVTEEDIARHRNLMSADSEVVFYPTHVRMVSMMVDELTQALGTHRNAWKKIYCGYFQGTDMFRNKSWRKLLKECELTAIMEHASGCRGDKVHEIIKMLHNEMRKVAIIHLKASDLVS